MKRIALVALLAVTSSLPAAAAEQASVGSPAPAFTLKDERGQPHSLAQYAGKIVVLEWTNPGCPFVKRHYDADTMRKTLGAVDGSKLVWLAVDSTASNTPAASAAWRAEKKLPYPVLQDASGAVGRAYGAKTTPHMFVIDAKGVVRYAGAIDDDPRGQSAKPVNHVRQALDALTAGKPVPTPSTAPYGCSVKYAS